MESSLMLHTFADEQLKVSSTEVVAVTVDEERVWVHMRDPLSFAMIEAKNPKDVLAWGRVSGKLLEDENEFEL